jgi:hypothetical protein
MFQTKVVENIKTHALFSIIFPGKRAVNKDSVEKYCKSRQATNAGIILRRKDSHCMPDN